MMAPNAAGDKNRCHEHSRHRLVAADRVRYL
jgi:hypothetical protein